jgi:type IV pilus assembly protein PilM
VGKYFYKPTPTFGLDIGHGSLKVMQLDDAEFRPRVLGYGQADFTASAVNNGVIAEPSIVAEQVFKLLTETMIGGVSSKQFVTAAPVANTYNSLLTLPLMKKDKLEESVMLEAEQVIPLPLDQLYIDYQVISKNKDDENQQVMFVAVPRTIIDSYIELADLLSLELRNIETTIDSTVRIISKTIKEIDRARLIIDLGSLSSDLAVWDNALQVTSVVNWGGDHLTRDIQSGLGISHSKASSLKRRYGINDGPQQKQLIEVLEDSSKSLIKEAKRIIRFYEQRKDGAKIDQIIIVGGGSSLKGIDDFLSEKLEMPAVRTTALDAFDFGDLQPPHPGKFGAFTSVAGLAMIQESDL